MRIKRALVSNFRGVRNTLLTDLGDVVVLAGQNGSGKSCVLDAIRLIKSIYGGYQQNEFHHWFGEFQINFSNDPAAFTSLFNDKDHPLVIEIDVELHPDERSYLKSSAELLITSQAWRALMPELYGWRSLNAAPFTAQFRHLEPEVKIQAAKDIKIFNEEIDLPIITARVYINPNQQPVFNPSKVLELVFSTFDLAHFGIIDYHGPHRIYGREVVNSINVNVNLDAVDDQRKQTTLYNYNAKYGNVKGEMAALYVKEALAAKAGVSLDLTYSITETLKELFVTFFPDKEFLGPQAAADGSVRFPVKVGGRETHDLDELSSGEKEILYGYLRLRNSAPKNSVILLDEPELHLNPRLTRSLPDFYHKHLASALGNQLWLITHSDAILRESVGKAGISVFHITPSSLLAEGANQATLIQADEDLEKAVIDLVGDLAAYNPGRRIVIFEGEDSDFDLHMTSQLFPELSVKANLISGTNKSRVRGLHNLLEKLSEAGSLPPSKIFSITDRDADPVDSSAMTNRLSWDAYHIENYLIEPNYIRKVLSDIGGRECSMSENDIEEDLKDCAKKTMRALISHDLSRIVNKSLVGSINLGIDPSSTDIATSLFYAINGSRTRLEKLFEEDLSINSVSSLVDSVTDEANSALNSDLWKKCFRGRDILKQFVGRHGGGIKYPIFRNLIISRMKDDGYKPLGMATILQSVLLAAPLVKQPTGD